MTDRIDMLEKRVKELEQELTAHLARYNTNGERFARIISNLSHFDDERRADASDLYQRLKQIELHLFPGIDTDVQRIYQITKSTTPPGHNPLDHRKPKKD